LGEGSTALLYTITVPYGGRLYAGVRTCLVARANMAGRFGERCNTALTELSGSVSGHVGEGVAVGCNRVDMDGLLEHS